MKTLTFLVIILIIIVLNGCKKGSVDSTTLTTDTSRVPAIIEGRVGYFSPVLSPNPDLQFPYPGGYQLTAHHWLTTDSPQVNVSGWIYLDGDYGLLKNEFVRVDGSWTLVMNTQNNKDYPYLIISVDSIWVIH